MSAHMRGSKTRLLAGKLNADWLLYIPARLAISGLADPRFAITLSSFLHIYKDARKRRRNGVFLSVLAMQITSEFDSFHGRELQ